MKNLLFNKYYKEHRVNWNNNYQPLRKDILDDIFSLITFTTRLPDIHPILSCFAFPNNRGSETTRKEVLRFKKKAINCESKKNRHFDILIVEEKKTEDKKKHYHALIIIDKNNYESKKKLTKRMQKLWHDINPDTNLYMQEDEHFHDLLSKKGRTEAFYAASYLAKENRPSMDFSAFNNKKHPKSVAPRRINIYKQKVKIEKKYWSSIDTCKKILSLEKNDEIYRTKEILKIIKLSRSTLYNLISKGLFPEPFKQGKYCVWFKKDLDLYFNKIIRKSQN